MVNKHTAPKGPPLTALNILFFAIIICFFAIYSHAEDKEPGRSPSRFHEMEVRILNSILTKNVPRKFDFNQMDFSLITGIGIDINQLKISENQAFCDHPLKDYDNFYTDEKITISIKALSLLLAKINMKEVTITRPVVHILQDENGNLSIDDLFKGNKGPVLSWLNVDDLTLTDGKLTFIDASPPRKPYVVVLDAVRTEVTGFSINETFKVNMSLRGPASEINNIFFNGMAGPIRDATHFMQVPVNMDFILNKTPVAPFSVYFPFGFPTPVSGQLSINNHVNGNLWSGLHMKGFSKIENIVISSDDGREKSIPFMLGISIDNDMILSLKENRLAIDDVKIYLNKSIFILDGQIANISKNPTFDLALSSQGIDFDDLKQVHPFQKEYMPDNFMYSGLSELNIHVTGDQKKINLSGQMDFTNTLLEVKDFFKKEPSSRHILTFEGTTFPETKTFEAHGEIDSGTLQILTPEWYSMLRQELTRSLNINPNKSFLAVYPDAPIIADSLNGHVELTDDKIKFQNIKFINCHQKEREGMDAMISGEIDLLNLTIDLFGDIILSEKDSMACLHLVSSEKTAKTSANNRMTIPIAITGPMSKPSIRLNIPETISIKARPVKANGL
ncbi:MAG: DUF748 domain-containing protein [Proteobacteria bacterium]|nr:DUF748 domain-containing protein [Pseudomonadota bacterium]